MEKGMNSPAYIFSLTGEDLTLAADEARALLCIPANTTQLIDRYLIAQTTKIEEKKHLVSRLALTKAIWTVLWQWNPDGQATEEELVQACSDALKHFNNPNTNTRPLFSGAFFLKTAILSDAGKRTLAEALWNSAQNPSVCLENGKLFWFAKIGKTYYLLEQWYSKPKKEKIISPATYPATKPIAIKPILARTCINLTGATDHIIDPFAGIGTTLVEAAKMGLYPIGFDIEYEMVAAAKKNLEYFGIHRYLLKRRDSCTLTIPLSYVFCDLPYGKNTKNITNDLYDRFFRMLEKALQKRAVVIVPHTWNRKALQQYQLQCTATYFSYVHSTLTRVILVLEPGKKKVSRKTKQVNPSKITSR
ncbi:MAG: DNA methyltransferase [Candidatus Woesearchaeota archaeon]